MARLARFFRRPSWRSTASDTTDHPQPTGFPQTPPPTHSTPSIPRLSSTSPPSIPRRSLSLVRVREKYHGHAADIPESVREQRESVVEVACEPKTPATSITELPLYNEATPEPPLLALEEPTPDEQLEQLESPQNRAEPRNSHSPEQLSDRTTPSPHTTPVSRLRNSPDGAVPSSSSPDTCRQDIAGPVDATFGNIPLDSPAERQPILTSAAFHSFPPKLRNTAAMTPRKIWVRRPGASATLVQIREDDLVDDVRDMILKKYANSLGRTFDAPDMTLRIAQRVDNNGPSSERTLGPEEEMSRTIDMYYPGGQMVDEALIIDVPQQKRTPRPSPRVAHHAAYHAADDYRPLENGTDYFPPMPALVPASMPQTTSSHESRNSHHHHSSIGASDHPGRSISVLNTGQLPPLPSPGSSRRHREHRPKYQRVHTSSPTIVTHPSNTGSIPTGALNLNTAHLAHRTLNRPRLDAMVPEAHHVPNGVPTPPPMPSPPAPEAAPTNKNGSPPPASSGVSLPYRPSRPRKSRKPLSDKQSSKSSHQPNESISSNLNLAGSMLDGSVPPINVLIVEDNIINLRILESLMKRLKVRWQTAMNGQIAVDKWRAGGFHLVLMDIQMPIMNGLQATKEIRRLERVNGIGVFSTAESSPTTPGDDVTGTSNGHANGEAEAKADDSESKAHPKEDNSLQMAEGFFKSPIIIVALTASSLQSDRHEALAAGCNDFLTKPVDFVWLERKVKEWGCMQALIDFDGWRKWKDYASKDEAGKTAEQRQEEAEKAEKHRKKLERLAEKQQELQRKKKEMEEEKRRKRQSVEAGAAATAATNATSESESADVSAGGATGTSDEALSTTS